MYLGPLLESNGRTTDQLRKMETEVNKNTAAIEVCQRDISELKEAATVGQSAKANQIANVQDLVREAALQLKNCKQLFITNGEQEAKVKETLNGILEREAKIERIIDLSNKNHQMEILLPDIKDLLLFRRKAQMNKKKC